MVSSGVFFGTPKPLWFPKIRSGRIRAVRQNQRINAALGASLLPGSATDFGKLLADETEKWGKVVKFAGAKPD
jgi:hypothetical protein